MTLQTSTGPAPTQAFANGSSPASSPAASPPLILAFLAIALVSAAMIAFFGWRRVHFVRSAGQWGMFFGDVVPAEGLGSFGGQRAAVDFGEEPKLWDLHTNRRKDGMARGTDARWESIMPLSAVVIRSNNGCPRRPEESPLLHHPSRLLFWVRPFQRHRKDDHDDETVSSSTKLQVAVAIALPSPHCRTWREGSNDGTREKDEWMDERKGKNSEYVIGLYENSWNEAK